MTESRNLPVPLEVPAVAAIGGPERPRAPAFPQERDDGIEWRRVLSALARYKWLVVLVTALGTGAGVAATRLLDPIYLAQATVWIDEADRRGPERGPIRSGQLLHAVSWPDLLESYVVLDAVARDERLYLAPRSPEDAAALAAFGLAERFRPDQYHLSVDATGAGYVLETSDGIELERGVLGDSIGTRLGFAWAPAPGSLAPGRSVEFTILTLRDAAWRLAENLQVRMEPEGNFVRLEMRGADPAWVARILNAVAERFVQVAAELKRRKITELTRILEEQLRSAHDNVAEAEAELERFRVRTVTLPSDRAARGAAGQGGGGGGGGGDPVFERFFELQVEREQLRRDREAMGRLLAQAPDSGVRADALGAIGAVRQAGELSEALKELSAKQAELRALRYRYADEYPPVRRLAQEIATLERRTIPALAGALAADLAGREAELDRRLAATAQHLRAIPPRALEEARLGRAAEIAADLYTTLEQRYEEARLAEVSSIPDVRILDPAVVPREPVKNTAPRVILVAFCASLGLAGLGAVLLDRHDPRVRYPEEVSRGMGLAILGAVPHLKQSRSGEPLSPEATGEVVEALRGVRMNVVYALRDARPLTLTVTSPGSGDGKSFVSANLALAFAEAGYRTLLVDGDLRRGAQHRRFGVARRPGLSDFLAEDALLGEIVQPTRFSALHLIGCGTRTREAPELLGSQRMDRLLRELASSYGVILCDSPPLAAAVDPYVLGTLTGSLLLVLRTGVSDREMAQAKLEVLSRLPVRLVGAVLNDVPPGSHYAYYAHSYYLPGYEAVDENAGTAGAGGPRVI